MLKQNAVKAVQKQPLLVQGATDTVLCTLRHSIRGGANPIYIEYTLARYFNN